MLFFLGAVWGQVEENKPTYQMYSTPVQIIDNKHCVGYEHDLCIGNLDYFGEYICHQVSFFSEEKTPMNKVGFRILF